LANKTSAARLLLVAVLTISAILYLIFLFTILQAMHWVRMPNPAGAPIILTGTPDTFFSMFWLSGILLIQQAASTYGGHIPLAAWGPAAFQALPVVSLNPLILSWLYPPTMGLLAVLQACLPLGPSFFLWRGLYFIISALLLRRAGLGWPAIIAGLAGPAACLDLYNGENGTLTGGLLASALLMLNRKPLTGGALMGFLSIKPQLGLMLPLILLRRRFWPALFGFALCVAVMVLLTLPLAGFHSWVWFFSGSRHSSVNMISVPFSHYFPAIGDTMFFMARSFGASLALAWALQAGTAGLAAACIWQVWGVQGTLPVPRMAVTISLAALLMPYGFLYDLVGFSVAMSAMFFSTSNARKPVYLMLWLFAGYSGIMAQLMGHILTPLGMALGAFMAWQEMRPLSAPAELGIPQHAHNPASAG
jgi:alpha-1,2-mannosyltransferase